MNSINPNIVRAAFDKLIEPTTITATEFILQIFVTVESPAIFILPAIFSDVGYLLGTLSSAAVGLLYIYTMRIYLWCDEQITNKTNLTNPTLYDLIDNTFQHSDHNRVKYFLKSYLKYEIILSWTLSMSFGILYATKNLQLILHHYHYRITDQSIMLLMLIPLTLISCLPHIKAISLFAYFVTSTLLVVLAEVSYCLLVTPSESFPHVVSINDWASLPNFIFTVFFVINSTPLIFPLKNQLKYPSNLRAPFGPLTVTFVLITLLNTLLSLQAYFKLGDQVRENVLTNLPQTDIVQYVNLLFTIAIVGGQALCFFVIFRTVWINELQNYFAPESRTFYQYVARTVLCWFIVAVAMLIPTFSLFVNVISCFSYPYDSILLPLVLETVVVWNSDERRSRIVFVVVKNIVASVVCVAACVWALYESVAEMVSYYDPALLPNVIDKFT